MTPSTSTDAPDLRTLLKSWEKGLRTLSMYLPNNPVRQQTIDARIYPVGTCVILDSFEIALVHAANSDATQVHRPIVRVLGDANGAWLDDPPLVDLAETEPDGSFTRSIIKVTDPDKYLINVSDYFV